MCGEKQLIPFEPTTEAKEKIWAKLSQSDCDFIIILTRCYLHTVEACIAVSVQEQMNEFEFFVLKAINILGSADIENINGMLHIGRQLIQQITIKLCNSKLLSEGTDGNFEMTPLGKTVLDTGQMLKMERKRYIFHFIDGSNEFVRINNSTKKYLIELNPNETPENWSFDIETLQKCINETNDWKQQRQFLTDIKELIRPELKNTTTEEGDAESSIIIDKAQLINCAILIKFNNNKPSELLAYPISPKGYLLSMDNLFSLSDEESILKVFPTLDEVPNNEQARAGFIILGQKHMLSNIENFAIESHKTYTTITIKDDDDIQWARFYWQNIQGNIFCQISSENVIRMNKFHIESEGNLQRAICLLFELNKSYLSENMLSDISTYKTWLSKKSFLTDEPIRQLASLAWDFSYFKLAYNLAELEDITDATI